MTVRDLLDRMDSRELTEWMAYESVCGTLGPERSDIHAGIIASTTANAAKGKRGKRFEPKDFIPQWDRKAQTWEEQLQIVKRVHGTLTRRDRRRAMRRKSSRDSGTNSSKEEVNGRGNDR